MEVKIGKIYRHFKGIEIKIIALGKHTETLEELDSHEIWVRPLAMFLSKVDHTKYPEVKQEYRFEEVYD